MKNLDRSILALFFIFCLMVFSSRFAFANALTITNFAPSSVDTTNRTMTFTFDIAWDNSWRDATNYDAVWIFMKRKNTSTGVWSHATMAESGTNPSGFSAPTDSEIIVPTDLKGFFFQRTDTGADDVSFEGVQFVWDYGADGFSDTQANSTTSTFKLFGTEMVYIPTGSFYAGDGTTSSIRCQFEDAATSNPKRIVSEDQLTLGGSGTGSLGNNNGTGYAITGDDFNDSTSKTLPAAFPKGYSAFYIMKYEITQSQYRDFLNTLTRDQQNTRTATSLASGVTSVTNRYVMSNNSSKQYRNGIRCDATIHTSDPITFYCDYDGNGTGNETTDGQWIAANYLSGSDLTAYLDWSGLRPMTELEYEKACRGPLTPVTGEYAWGTINVATSAYSLSYPGEATEVISANYTTGNALYTTTKGSGTSEGPFRVGIFAGTSGNTGKETAGASYYGVMELTGNMHERPISVGSSSGRAFTGLHGNGSLDATGDSDVTYWPATDNVGLGFRGNNWNVGINLEVSQRPTVNYAYNGRLYTLGGRGARTAP